MKKYKWDLDKIKDAVKESINFTEVLEKINIPRQGNNSKTLRTILDKYNIDYSHFTGRARVYTINHVDISDYLNNLRKIKTSELKEKLLKEGLKEYKCENPECGLTEWLGKPIVLQLHHIDGNNNNNNLENLQLLCPNCHSQTENYCGSANTNNTKYYCKDCGREINKYSTYCTMCSHKHHRKVERPSKEEIEVLIKTESFLEIGRKYGVSDNAIRKWCKDYNLPFTKKEIKKCYENK